MTDLILLPPEARSPVPWIVGGIMFAGIILGLVLIGLSGCAPLPTEPLEAVMLAEGRDVTSGGTVPRRRTEILEDVTYTVDERRGSVRWEGEVPCVDNRPPHYLVCGTVLRVLSGPYAGHAPIRSSCLCPSPSSVQVRPYGMAPARVSITFHGFQSVRVYRGDVTLPPGTVE